MKNNQCLLAIAALAFLTAAAPVLAGSKSDSAKCRAAFERMKTLSGEWRGHIGQRNQGDEVTVLYKTVAGGSAVVETLFPGTPHEMVTVYHLDGDKLVLTHYCAAGNQPKMALTKKSTADALDFDFVGGTNVNARKGRHMHSARIRFESKDAIAAEWDSVNDGKMAEQVKFFLARKS